ncbi:MAG: N-acetylneuraminate synthase family protein [Planctomycetota bacterium]
MNDPASTGAIEIGGRRIGGPDGHVFVIAEAGVNHEGDLGVAMELLESSADAGADAIKFQAILADTLFAPSEYGSEFHRLFKKAELSEADYQQLADRARSLGLVFMMSFNDRYGIDLGERLGVGAHKLASTLMSNTLLVRAAARTGKPLVISTGMSHLSDVETAINAAAVVGDNDLALMHCVSNYPCEWGELNLRVMDTLSGAFGVPVGFSDHSIATEAPLVAAAAVARGATLLERHVTLDKSRPSFDHRLSSEPEEFVEFVRAARSVTTGLGSGRKAISPGENKNRKAFRTSLAPAKPIEVGEVINESMLTAVRPEGGVPPELFVRIIGKPARRAMAAGEPLTWDDL